ncbi:MAG: hypothetical protein JJT78_04090 [Leptospira sp.]|nr:hypothetical protein [Leptospira sp.]
MKSRITAFIALNLFCFGYLGSQEVPFLSAFVSAPWINPNWETSYSIPRQDPIFLDAIAIPFNFPMESALLYSYSDAEKLAPGRVSQSNDIRLSSLGSRNQPIIGQRGVAYLLRKKNFGLNLDLSLQMAGNEMGMNFMEIGIAKARFSYRVPNQLLGMHASNPTKMDLFLELSQINSMSPNQVALMNRPVQNTLAKSAENNNRPAFTAKQLYASPGVSVNTSSNFIFEGMVRVPMNSREANRTLDELWTPEIQTNLGMKYIIPVH